jgi:protein-tyrosine kinase
MSEIHKWLKLTEVSRPKSLPGSDLPPLVPEEHYNKSREIVPEPSFLPESRVQPFASLGTGHTRLLDLNNANARIKRVLDPSTLVGEQYRLLRAKLSVMQNQRGIKTLLVTSSVPNEGKTFSACCLASILAQEPGKRILLIDGDLRKPKAGSNFGLEYGTVSNGLSRILKGTLQMEEALFRFRDSDLFLLPSGELPPNPAELLSLPTLDRTIKQSAELFDWVIIDSPPNLVLADPSLLAAHCDAVLIIVRAQHTPSKLITETIERLGRDKICGVILNRVRGIKSSRYYSHYYKRQ